jgi:hypothetical protein
MYRKKSQGKGDCNDIFCPCTNFQNKIRKKNHQGCYLIWYENLFKIVLGIKIMANLRCLKLRFALVQFLFSQDETQF